MRGSLQRLRDKLHTYSMMKRVALIKFADLALLENVYEQAYYGDNQQEQQRVKGVRDKDSFFCWPKGVKSPLGQAGRGDGCEGGPSVRMATSSSSGGVATPGTAFRPTRRLSMMEKRSTRAGPSTQRTKIPPTG